MPTAQIGLTPQDVNVETPLMRVVLSTVGARVTSRQLKAYKIDTGAPVDLVATPSNQTITGALAVWPEPEQLDAVFQADKNRLELTQSGSTGSVTFSHVSLSGIQAQKTVTFRADHYDVQVDVTFRNLAEDGTPVQPRIAWGPGLRNSNTSASTAQPPTLWLDGKRVQEDLAKLTGERVIEGKLSWIALQDSYFTAAFLPKDANPRAFVSRGASDQGVVGLIEQKQTLARGAEAKLSVQVCHAGPRDLDTLKAVGQNLDQLIDLDDQADIGATPNEVF